MNVVLLVVQIAFWTEIFWESGTVVNAVFLAYICTLFLLYFYGCYGAGTGGYAGETCGIVRWRCDYLSGIVNVSDAG